MFGGMFAASRRLSRIAAAFVLFAALVIVAPGGVASAAPSDPVFISEFIATSDSSLEDNTGDFPDWIELHNPSGAAVDLTGWTLTADDDVHTFSGLTIGAGEYLVIFASGSPERTIPGELHVDMKLGAGGESLILADASGEVTSPSWPVTYPPQSKDISYGVETAGGAEFFFSPSTPRAANGTGVIGFAEPVTFSIDHGFYETPQTIVLDTPTTTATIRYTTDGSTPSATNGTALAPGGSVVVDQTTNLRAVATQSGWASSPVETRSYMYASDIVLQAETPPPGWPDDLEVNDMKAWYGIDSDLNAAELAIVETQLTAIPTVSITTDLDNLFSPTTGIWSNPLERGSAWERQASIELIDPTGAEPGFEINGGIRIRGNSSRKPTNFKHSMRLVFDDSYGDGDLEYPLFGAEGDDKFEKVDLRTGQSWSWAAGRGRQNTLLRDIWNRDTQGAMGHEYTRSRYVHLYLNGHYWGLYMTEERVTNQYGKSYGGGEESDYDVIKRDTATDGRPVEARDGLLDDWLSMWPMVEDRFLDDDEWVVFQDEVDVENLIDFYILSWFAGDSDSTPRFTKTTSNNWLSIRNRAREGTMDKWVFIDRDSESALCTVTEPERAPDWDPTLPWNISAALTNKFPNEYRLSPAWLMESALSRHEFVQMFKDRVQLHVLDPGGAMTVPESLARLEARFDTVDLVIDAEAARWGDTKGEPGRDRSDWEVAVDEIRECFQLRIDVMEDYLREDSLWPGMVPTAPESTIDTPPPGVVLAGSSFTATGTATDDVGVAAVNVAIQNNDTLEWLRQDGSFGAFEWLDTTLEAEHARSMTWEFTTSLPNGDYTLTSRAVDTAAVEEISQPTLPFEIEASEVEPPNGTVTSPGANNADIAGPTIMLAGLATDDIAVSDVSVRITDRDSGLRLQADGSFGTPFTKFPATLAAPGTPVTAWDFETTLPDGSYAVSVFVTDWVGKTDSTRAWRSFVVTATPPTVPTALTVADVTETTVDLTWTESTDDVGVDHYDIIRDGVVIGSTPDATPAFQDTGLSVGVTYTYSVRAVDAAGAESGDSAPVDATTAPTADVTPPSVPTALAVTATTTTTASLSWTASTDDVGVDHYEVVRESGGVTVVVATADATPSFTDTGLDPLTTYNYSVRAVDAAGNTSADSTPLVPATTLADTEAPSVPADLSTTAIGETTVDLAWTASTDNVGVDHYDIVRDGVVVASTLDATPSFQDTGLAPVTLYTYEVIAVDAAGNTSAVSASVDATTADGTAPSVPTDVAVTATTAGTASLTWTASTDNVAVDHYEVVRESGGVTVVVPTADATPSFTDTGLDPLTTYNYSVRAVDAAGNTSADSTPVVPATTLADTEAPSVPAGLASTDIGETTVDLAWAASTDNVGVDHYDIVRDGVVIASTPDATPSFQDSGVVVVTTYTYAVRAVDGAGNSSTDSATIMVTTVDETSPTAPTDLTATAETDTTLSFTWTASTDNVGVDHYDILRDGLPHASTPDATPSFLDAGLPSGTTFSYEVIAVDAAGNSTLSPDVLTLTTTIGADPPTTPTDLAVGVTTATTVDLTWTASTDLDGVGFYLIVRDGAVVAMTADGTPSFTDTGLDPLTSYSYEVRAVDTLGNESANSDPAGPATTTADTEAPTAPGAPVVDLAGETTVDLSWPAATDNHLVARYDIVRDGVVVGSTPDATPSYQDSGLTIDQTYTYAIRAIDASGNPSADSSTVDATTGDATPPSIPTDLAAPVVTETTVDLTWTAATDNVGVVRYNILRDTVLIASTADATPSFQDTGLSAGTNYVYEVQAVDAAGNVSPSSTSLAVTTGDLAAPTVPTALTVTGTTASTASLSWTASTDNVGVDHYDILRDGVVVGTSPSGTTTFTDTGLTAGATYTYTVRAADAAGNVSDESDAAVATTGGDTVDADGQITTPTQDQVFTSNPVEFTGTATDNVGVTLVHVSIKNKNAGDPNFNKWLQSDLVSWGGYRRLPATVLSPGATSTGWTYSISLPDGDYSLQVTAEDAAGNRDSNKPNRRFTVDAGGPVDDTTKPTGLIINPDGGSPLNGLSHLFDGTASDNVAVTEVELLVRDLSTFKYLRRDGSFGNYQKLDTTLDSPGAASTDWSTELDLPPGDYWVKVLVTDSSGNENSPRPKRFFTVN